MLKLFLVDYGNIHFTDGKGELMYLWKLADANEYLLRTWISICFSLDYSQNSMEMYKNGKILDSNPGREVSPICLLIKI